MEDTTQLDRNSVESMALRAIQLLVAGQHDDGLRLYSTIFRHRVAQDIPFGLHARMLEARGLPDAAQMIIRRALQSGFDIGCRLGPERARIKEYEACFAAGRANATMVANYLMLLDQVGDGNATRPWTVLDPLLQQRMLPDTSLTAGLVEAAADALEQKAACLPAQREVKSIRNMRRITDVHRDDSPSLVELHRLLKGMAMAYASRLRDAEHPYARLANGEFIPKPENSDSLADLVAVR